MLDGLVTTAKSLSYQTLRQEMATHNVAQSGSAGFKAMHVTAHAAGPEGAPHPAPAVWTDWQQGAVRDTGRPFDLALEGDGFLVVRTPDGERLTRGGSFRLDAEGLLTDLAGNPLLGEAGPLHLFGSSIEVNTDGSLYVDGAPAGRLRLATVSDPAALEREDAGRFRSGERPQPAADGSVQVRQGAIEDTNAQPVLSMVELVSIHRAYAANIQVLKAFDQVLEATTSRVGSPQ